MDVSESRYRQHLQRRHWEEAQQTIGSFNFFGVSVASQYLGLEITPENSAPFAKIPFQPNVIYQSRKTHLLIADIGISVIELYRKFSTLFWARSGCQENSDPWWLNEEFARARETPTWRLIRKNIIASSEPELGWRTQGDSNSKDNWLQFQSFVPVLEQKVSVRTLVYLNIMYYAARQHQRLYDNVLAYSNTVLERGNIQVGFMSYKLLITHLEGNPTWSGMGITSEIIPKPGDSYV